MLVALFCCQTVACILVSNRTNSMCHANAKIVSEIANTEKVPFSMSAKATYLIDYDSKTVIAKNNENQKLPIASMTKIMTLLLAFENIENGKASFMDEVLVSETASKMGGSQVFLDANSKHKYGDLLKAITIASANDASVAIAEHIAGSEQNFVSLMNEKCKELQMSNTHFSNSTGLPAPQHHSSAKDVCTMLSSLLKHEKYFEFSTIFLQDYIHPDGRKTSMTNTNKLVRFYKGCDGGKTGYTSEAGHCLAATASRNGLRIVSVVIGEPNSKTRFKEVSDMFNYCFKNYENKNFARQGDNIENSIGVQKGKSTNVRTEFGKNLTSLAKIGEENSYEVKTEIVQNVQAPISKGQVLGKAFLFKNSIAIAECDIVASEDVLKATFLDEIKRFLDKW